MVETLRFDPPLAPGGRGSRIVAIGFFDGVHAGHRAVLAESRRLAALHGHPVSALTFVEHPRTVLRPEEPVPLLSTWGEKRTLLQEAGADEVLGLHFTPEVAGMDPADFVEDVLGKALGAAHVVVGFNFRFGRAARGTPDMLAEAGGRLGLGVTIVPPFQSGEVTVSSTAIREAVSQGDMELAARLLGRPFTLTGLVVPGDRRGRELGFPTANLALAPDRLWPADGVYGGHATWEGGEGPCVLNLGMRPTFAGREHRFEVHVLDQSSDLYGQNMVIRPEFRIRGEERFPSVDALVARIREDVAEARRRLGTGATA